MTMGIVLYPVPDEGYYSSFFIGDINPPYADSTFTWSKVLDPNSTFWTIPLNRFLVNNASASVSADYAILDSGTTGFLMTDEDF